jgi:hypothetical protein
LVKKYPKMVLIFKLKKVNGDHKKEENFLLMSFQEYYFLIGGKTKMNRKQKDKKWFQWSYCNYTRDLLYR